VALAIARTAAVTSGQTSTRSAERTPQLPALTGLRAVVALWVVLSHCATWWRPGLIGPSALATVVADGQMGVYLFFVLSGFILSYTYLAPDRTFRGAWRGFYVARLARVYPVYLVALVCALIPFFAWGSDLPTAVCRTSVPPALTVLATVLVAQQWLPGYAYCLNPPGWSLSVEAAFYLVFPVLALLIGGLSRRALALLLSTVCLGYVVLTTSTAASVNSTWPVFWWPVFLAGMIAGRLWVLRGAAQRHYPLAGTAMVLGIIVVLLTTHTALVPLSSYLLPLYVVLLGSLAVGRGWLAAFLSTSALVTLGEASYTLP